LYLIRLNYCIILFGIQNKMIKTNITQLSERETKLWLKYLNTLYDQVVKENIFNEEWEGGVKTLIICSDERYLSFTTCTITVMTEFDQLAQISVLGQFETQTKVLTPIYKPERIEYCSKEYEGCGEEYLNPNRFTLISYKIKADPKELQIYQDYQGDLPELDGDELITWMTVEWRRRDGKVCLIEYLDIEFHCSSGSIVKIDEQLVFKYDTLNLSNGMTKLLFEFDQYRSV
jgi:hypothetical protein